MYHINRSSKTNSRYPQRIGARRRAFENLEQRWLLTVPGSPVLELTTENGVVVSSGTVTQWSDQSGHGNHVFGAGASRPSFGSVQTPTGANSITFDGNDDRLIRDLADGLNDLPGGNEPRSIFFVGRFHGGNAWGGVAYGAGDHNEAFGVGVVNSGTNRGDLFVQGYGGSNDIISNEQGFVPPNGPTTGWKLLSAVHDADGGNPANNLFFYSNGNQIEARTKQYNTDIGDNSNLNGKSRSRLVLGQEAKELGHIRTDIAASLIYNRALADSERQAVEDYLHFTFFDHTGNAPPVAQNDHFSISSNAILNGNVFSNNGDGADADVDFDSFHVIDVDGRGGSVGSLITLPSGARLALNSNGSFSYDPNGQFGQQGSTNSDSFSYTISDGNSYGFAEVTITFSDVAQFQTQTIVGGLQLPTSFEVLPDGRVIVLEKAGDAYIVNPNHAVPSLDPYLSIEDGNGNSLVISDNERGLTDIALDPNFATNGHFYLYYHSNATNRARVSRFTHDVDHAEMSSEFVLWEDNELVNAQNRNHWGGGLDFGPDGKLYLTIGDKWVDPNDSQDPNSFGGKILRLNPDGSIPNDNPFFGNDPGGFLDEIWAYGLRNPFRANWDLPTNRFFIGDVGGNVQATAREEINLGVAGANYGWPAEEGFNSNPAFTDPIYDYGHTAATPNGGSVSGGVVYRGNQFPQEYQGAYFFGDYVLGFIEYLKFDGNGNVIDANPATPQLDAFPFSTVPIAPIAFEVGIDGSLYYLDIALGQIGSISVVGGNQAPIITQAIGTPRNGIAPLTVSFAGQATDPDNGVLSYEWFFGDGTSTNGANVNHTYTSSGSFTANLHVSDGQSTTISNPVQIVIGQEPQVNITSPVDGSLFRAGDTITLAASVIDDGPINGDDYSWTARFLHNAHTHPVFDNVTGETLSFVIGTTGHDFSDNTGYEIELVVTDADGISVTDSVSVYPDKVDVTVNTNFPGDLTFTLDGIPRSGNFVHDSLINFQHTLEVPSTEIFNGTTYAFAGWSNGESTTSNTFTVPTSDLTLTAMYQATGSSPGLKLEHGSVSTINTGWTTVTLNENYSSMVPVATVINDKSGPSLITRIRNAGAGNTFDVRVDRVDGQSGTVTADVHYWVVEEGVYTQAQHGVNLEAFKMTSTVTDRRGSWNGVDASGQLLNTYSSPAVFGQVLTYNDSDFSSFWARGATRYSVPTSSSFFVGKHVAEDFDTTRAPEELGVIVIESGSGVVNGISYESGVGADIIDGVANGAAGDSYPLSLTSATTAVATIAGMQGHEGGWAILHRSNPVGDNLQLAIEEDQIRDGERGHTTERVAYIVFAGSGGGGTPANSAPVAFDDALSTNEDVPFSDHLFNNNGNGSDFDPDGDPFFVVAVEGQASNVGSSFVLPSGSTLLVTASGTFSYNPNGLFNHLAVGQTVTDTFTYDIGDGNGGVSRATATVSLVGVNDSPVLSFIGNQSVAAGSSINVLVSATDPDSAQLSLSASGLPSFATFTNNGNGTATLNINPLASDVGFYGGVSISVSDGANSSDSETITIQVTSAGGNSPPDARDDSFVTDEDTAVSGNLFADNGSGADFDPESDPFTVVAINGSSNQVGRQITLPLGTKLTVNANGSFVHDSAGQFEAIVNGQVAFDSFTYTIRDSAGGHDTATATVAIHGITDVTGASGPKINSGIATVDSANWTTVSLSDSYSSMVVVATVMNDKSTTPVVTRIRNANGGNSFDIKLDRASGGSGTVSRQVHYLVVEEGSYTLGAHGIKMDAFVATSSVTDRRGAWNGQNQASALTQSFTQPVVLGQVMTYNDPSWSTFWARGATQYLAPTTSNLIVGKHVGEDSDRTRANEQLGVIVIEAGTGVSEGLAYEAFLGADSIDGIANAAAGGSYPLGLSNSPVVVATQAAMEGNEGGWAVLHGAGAVGADLDLAIDEDQFRDSERGHTTEQVAVVAFSALTAPPPKRDLALQADINRDGAVDFRDFLLLNSQFEKRDPLSSTDLNDDGTVDFRDFIILSESFGRHVEHVATLPDRPEFGLDQDAVDALFSS